MKFFELLSVLMHTLAVFSSFILSIKCMQAITLISMNPVQVHTEQIAKFSTAKMKHMQLFFSFHITGKFLLSHKRDKISVD